MQIIPAIDLLDGKAVRLHQGRYDEVTVYDEDPPGRAASFAASSAALHVVDLAGARAGRAVQEATVRAVVARFGAGRGPEPVDANGGAIFVGVQVGGGIRTVEAAESYLALGVARLVLGTAAVHDRPLVERLVQANPGRVILALDARDGLVAVDGWTKTSELRAVDVARSLRDLPLAGVLYTDISRDGTGVGPNVEATARLAGDAGVRVIASGGIGTLEHLRALARAGVPAAIVGRALYDGRFTVAEAIDAAR